jgi:hypothetical protein
LTVTRTGETSFAICAQTQTRSIDARSRDEKM